MSNERSYGRVSPRFWTGRTGEKIKRRGLEGVVVATYLMTSPHSNMLGLYRQPVMYMAEETGMTFEGASKGLASCIDAGFCAYDEATKMVWVFEMAKWQISDELSLGDKRCAGIRKDYAALPNCPFVGPFFDRYAKAFHLTQRREYDPEDDGPIGSPFEAPSKPGTGTGTGTGTGAGTGAELRASLALRGGVGETAEARFELSAEPGKPARAKRATKPKADKPPAPTTATFEAYAKAYRSRYSTEPLRNAQVNGQLAQFVGKVGADEAPLVAAFYVGHNRSDYVRSMHDTALLLRDAAGLRTQWATRRQVTTTQATQADRTQTNAGAFAGMIAAARAREAAQANTIDADHEDAA